MITWEQFRDGILSGWYRCEEHYHQKNACYEYDDDDKSFMFTFEIGKFGRTQKVIVRYAVVVNLGFVVLVDSPIGLVEYLSKGDLFDLLHDVGDGVYGLVRLNDFVCLRDLESFDGGHFSAEDIEYVTDSIFGTSFGVAKNADKLEEKYLGGDEF